MLEKRKLERMQVNKSIKLYSVDNEYLDTVELKNISNGGISFISNIIYDEHQLIKFSLDDAYYVLYIIWGASIKDRNIFEYGGRIFELKI